MKRSNLLLLTLSVVLLSGLYSIDRLLAIQYLKIDLDDPYKNFQYIPVTPFRALDITGGNGYAIRIMQGEHYSIRVMNSRKSFFTMVTANDTLRIGFSVANQQYQKAEDCTVALAITTPGIDFLKLSGTNNELALLHQDSLTVLQDKNTVTRIKELRVHYIKLQGTGMSSFDFQYKNNAGYIDLHLQNMASANFHQINFQQFHRVLQDSSAIVLSQAALEMLRLSILNAK